MKKLSVINESMGSDLLAKLSKTINGPEFLNFLRKRTHIDIHRANVKQIAGTEEQVYLGNAFVIFDAISGKMMAAGVATSTEKSKILWAFNETKINSLDQLNRNIPKFKKSALFLISSFAKQKSAFDRPAEPDQPIGTPQTTKLQVVQFAKMVKPLLGPASKARTFEEVIENVFNYLASVYNLYDTKTFKSVGIVNRKILIEYSLSSENRKPVDDQILIMLYSTDFTSATTLWTKIFIQLLNSMARYQYRSWDLYSLRDDAATVAAIDKLMGAQFKALPLTREFEANIQTNAPSARGFQYYDSPSFQLRLAKRPDRETIYALNSGKTLVLFVRPKSVGYWSNFSIPGWNVIIRSITKSESFSSLGGPYGTKKTIDVSGLDIAPDATFAYSDQNRMASYGSWKEFVKTAEKQNFEIIGSQLRDSSAAIIQAYEDKLRKLVKEVRTQLDLDTENTRYNYIPDTILRFVESTTQK